MLIAEHLALLLMPLILAVKRVFVVFPPTTDVLAMAVVCKCLYHSGFLAYLALFTGRNLNYMLSPPPGLALTCLF